MKLILFLVVLTVYTVSSDSSIYNEIKDNLLAFIKRASDGKTSYISQIGMKAAEQLDMYERIMKMKEKSKKKYEESKKNEKVHDTPVTEFAERFKEKKAEKEHYRLDPILNFISRKNLRRKYEDTSEESSSSSQELEDWKDEWKRFWLKKKFEAINSSDPQGDTVNMVAARPWGVACGDPNQHDMPWGSCLMAMECEAEFRIYRGDYLCGRTEFVCCALQLTTYDMYQGFDVSFDDSELSTSEDERSKAKGSSEKKARKRRRQKNRRKKDRKRRKEKMRKSIRKIISEIRRILNRMFKNGTKSRGKKTKQLKKFIKDLKKQYRKDRESVKDIHDSAILKIDEGVKAQLNKLKTVNQNFMKNATFRDIVVNGTTDKRGMRMLIQAYPDLAEYFRDKTRRSNSGRKRRYNDYDVEYGLLYN